eukprot:129871-Prymnesium_polylepis.1
MDLPVRTFAILERARAITRLPWPVVPRFRARCVTALGSSGGSGGGARVRLASVSVRAFWRGRARASIGGGLLDGACPT